MTTNDKIRPIYKFCNLDFNSFANNLGTCIKKLRKNNFIDSRKEEILNSLYNDMEQDNSFILLINLLYNIVMNNNKNNSK